MMVKLSGAAVSFTDAHRHPTVVLPLTPDSSTRERSLREHMLPTWACLRWWWLCRHTKMCWLVLITFFSVTLGTLLGIALGARALCVARQEQEHLAVGCASYAAPVSAVFAMLMIAVLVMALFIAHRSVVFRDLCRSSVDNEFNHRQERQQHEEKIAAVSASASMRTLMVGLSEVTATSAVAVSKDLSSEDTSIGGYGASYSFSGTTINFTVVARVCYIPEADVESSEAYR